VFCPADAFPIAGERAPIGAMIPVSLAALSAPDPWPNRGAIGGAFAVAILPPICHPSALRFRQGEGGSLALPEGVFQG